MNESFFPSLKAAWRAEKAARELAEKLRAQTFNRAGVEVALGLTAGISTFSMTYDYQMVDGHAVNAAPAVALRTAR